MTGSVGSLLGLNPYSSTSFLRNSSPSLRCFRLRQRKRAASTIKATATTGTTTATAILPPAERPPEEVEEEAAAVAMAAPLDLLADDFVAVTLDVAEGVGTEPDDVEVRVIVFGCGVPSLVEDVSTILVTWRSEVDEDDVGAAAAAAPVEEVGDTTTSEGGCDVVDIDVEVVSTITALLEGVGTAPGAVGRTTREVELNTTGAATVPLFAIVRGYSFVFFVFFDSVVYS